MNSKWRQEKKTDFHMNFKNEKKKFYDALEPGRGGTCNAETNFLAHPDKGSMRKPTRCLASVRGFHRTNLSRWLVINSCIYVQIYVSCSLSMYL